MPMRSGGPAGAGVAAFWVCGAAPSCEPCDGADPFGGAGDAAAGAGLEAPGDGEL